MSDKAVLTEGLYWELVDFFNWLNKRGYIDLNYWADRDKILREYKDYWNKPLEERMEFFLSGK